MPLQFMERWIPLLMRHRLLAIGLTLAAIAAIAVGIFTQRDTRIALFAEPLGAEQVTEVVAQLAAWNIPFVAMPDNVRVDAGKRSDVLLKLSLVGVPHAHITTSHEVFANVGPLTPQSVLDAQQLDGVAGDLAMGLRGMTPISDARIIIAPAKPGVFADEPSHDASASVRITLRPGSTLTNDQVEGIRAFVAAGVPGLESRRVAILDDRGTIWGASSAQTSDDANGLQASLQSAFDTAFGFGATIVRVRAIHDAQTREVREVRRMPLAGQAIGKTTFEERFAGESKRYSKTQSNEDRGSDVQEEKMSIPAGRLTRLSVAVMLDADRHIDALKVRDIAGATLGIAPQQGDTLSVQEISFAKPFAVRPSPFVTAFGYVATVLPTLIVVSGMLLAVRWSAKPLGEAFATWRERVMVHGASEAVIGFAPAQVRGALHGEPPYTAAAVISRLPTATATAVLEMYSPEERAAIVRRMQRATAPIVPDYQALVQRG